MHCQKCEVQLCFEHCFESFHTKKNGELEHAIRKVQEIRWDWNLNGTHQFPVYADDDNTMDKNKNINTIIKNNEALLMISKDVSPRSKC